MKSFFYHFTIYSVVIRIVVRGSEKRVNTSIPVSSFQLEVEVRLSGSVPPLIRSKLNFLVLNRVKPYLPEMRPFTDITLSEIFSYKLHIMGFFSNR